MPKVVHFGEFLKIWIGQKLVKNSKIKKFKWDILGDFQTMWIWDHFSDFYSLWKCNNYIEGKKSLGRGGWGQGEGQSLKDLCRQRLSALISHNGQFSRKKKKAESENFWACNDFEKLGVWQHASIQPQKMLYQW